MKSFIDRIQRYRLRRGDSQATALYARVLIYLVRTSRAELAVEWFVQHPAGGITEAINAAACEVDGTGVDRVYAGTMRPLGQVVRDGTVRDTAHMRQLGLAVLRTNSRHYEILSWHRDHPTLPPDGTLGIDGEPVRRPFVTDRVDVARQPAPAADPTLGAEYQELMAAVLREARGVGRLHVRAFGLYRRYVAETGRESGSGAYPDMARRAILDEDGRVVGFCSWRAAPVTDAPPSRALVRRVRALHLDACERMYTATRRLGYDFPPVG